MWVRSNLILRKILTIFLSFRFICGKKVFFSSRHPSCFLLPTLLLPPFRSKPLSLSHTHTTERRKRRGKGAPSFFATAAFFSPFFTGEERKRGGRGKHTHCTGNGSSFADERRKKEKKKVGEGGGEKCVSTEIPSSHVRSPFFSFFSFFCQISISFPP